MKKAIFAMAIATMFAVSCTTGTSDATSIAVVDSTSIKVDSTVVDTTAVSTQTSAESTSTVK